MPGCIEATSGVTAMTASLPSSDGRARSELRTIARTIDTLPSLPKVVAKILETFSEEDPSIDDLVSVIESDQAVAMKILKRINSAFYGLATRVASIRKAVMMLGCSDIRSILLCVTISESMSAALERTTRAIHEDLWKHTLACAVCAEMIVDHHCPARKGEAFAGGLLHDLGKLILLECFPDKFRSFIESNTGLDEPSLLAEAHIFGADHAAVGMWLAEKWGLPDTLTEAIGFHHHAPSDIHAVKGPETAPFIFSIQLGNNLVHELMADGRSTMTRMDREYLLDALSIPPDRMEAIMSAIGRHYSERAAFFNLKEGEYEFYYDALRRSGKKWSVFSEHSTHLQTVEKRFDHLSLLLELNADLAHSDEPDEILRKTAQRLRAGKVAHEGVIYRVEDRARAPRGFIWTSDTPCSEFDLTPTDGETPSAHAGTRLDGRQAHMVEASLGLLFRASPSHHLVGDPVGDHTWVVVPLVVPDRITGALCMGIDERRGDISTAPAMDSFYDHMQTIITAALSKLTLIEKLRDTADSLSEALKRNSWTLALLEESRRDCEHLFEYSNDAIVLHHSDGTLIRVNERTGELLGVAPAELMTRYTIHDILPASPSPIHEWGREGGTRHEARLKHHDGSLIDVDISSRVVDDGADIIQSTFRDITHQKRTSRALASEKERLAITLRSIGDGVVTTDTRGCVTLLNRAAEVMTGWNHREASGKRLDHLIALVDEETRVHFDPVTTAIHAGTSVEGPSPSVMISRHGREVLVSPGSAPIVDGEKKIIGVVLVIHDITETRQLELERMKIQRLESAGIIAGGIAHDFNNILTVISGNISLAKMLLKPDHGAFDKLTQAEIAARRAKDLTHQLLTFSKKGRTSNRVTTQVSSLVAEAHSVTLRGPKVRLDCGLPDDLWTVSADIGQLNQVFTNLVINADQAMPDGGVITVRAENLSVERQNQLPLPPGRYVRITVRDQGLGIARDNLPKIFDPYFTTKKDGTGLGLASAFSILKSHDGYIRAESTEFEGAAFHVYLPVSGDEGEGDDVSPIHMGNPFTIDKGGERGKLPADRVPRRLGHLRSV